MAGLDAESRTHRSLSTIARPLRLFARPEPVEAIAEVPDGPPVRFRWRRALYRVARAEGPERIAAEWWRDDDLTRDYFRVEDVAGHRFWLFREGLYGRETDGPALVPARGLRVSVRRPRSELRQDEVGARHHAADRRLVVERDLQRAVAGVDDGHLGGGVAVDRLRPGDGQPHRVAAALARQVRRPDVVADIGAAVAAGVRVEGQVGRDRPADEPGIAMAADRNVGVVRRAGDLAADVQRAAFVDDGGRAGPGALETVEVRDAPRACAGMASAPSRMAPANSAREGDFMVNISPALPSGRLNGVD